MKAQQENPISLIQEINVEGKSLDLFFEDIKLNLSEGNFKAKGQIFLNVIEEEIISFKIGNAEENEIGFYLAKKYNEKGEIFLFFEAEMFSEKEKEYASLIGNKTVSLAKSSIYLSEKFQKTLNFEKEEKTLFFWEAFISFLEHSWLGYHGPFRIYEPLTFIFDLNLEDEETKLKMLEKFNKSFSNLSKKEELKITIFSNKGELKKIKINSPISISIYDREFYSGKEDDLAYICIEFTIPYDFHPKIKHLKEEYKYDLKKLSEFALNYLLEIISSFPEKSFKEKIIALIKKNG